MVNPPLFAWIEWEYARFTGDASRLPRVLPLLDRYYGWLEANLRADEGRGLYYQTDLGSGMDNTPRGDVAFGGWIDMSAQQALAARHLARIARAVGDVERERRFTATFEDLRARIDALAWDEADGIYYDVTRGGARARVKHVGAFWPMLAGVADAPKAARLAAHLRDPREFWRPHPFPSLAASEPAYVPAGQYWRGGVWAPTNAMILRGLRATGARAIAREAAERHLAALAAVYASPPTDETRVAPEERDGAYATLWELYSPERPEPGTRWDGQYYGRQDFVGWTGLGPIAALFEDVLGIEVVGSESTLALDLARTDAHGVRRMPLGEGEVDVLVDPRPTPASPARVHVRATRPFVLEGRRDGAAPVRVDVCAGSSVVTLP